MAAVGSTARTHTSVLAVGVVPWIVWGGRVSLVGTLVGITAAARFWRCRALAPRSAVIGVVAMALASVAWSALLAWIGAGPL